VSFRQYLDAPAEMKLDRSFWVAAAAVAVLRKAVNDPFRQEHRSRGEAKNLLNDLEGAAGELAALKHFGGFTGSDLEVTHDILSLHGPVDEVDFRIEEPDGITLMEVKALLVESGKGLFLINREAFGKSRRRGAQGYLPVLSSEGSGLALLGTLLTMDQVGKWREYDFGYGDPAVGVPLGQLTQANFGRTEDEVRELLEGSRFGIARLEGDLDGVISDPVAELGRLRRDSVSISPGQGYDSVVRFLAGICQHGA